MAKANRRDLSGVGGGGPAVFTVAVTVSEEQVANCLCSALMAEKYPRHFAALTGENDDAETGDVLLQCSVLGGLIYG